VNAAISFIGRAAGALLLLAPVSLFAETLQREPEVPAGLQFVRTIDIEGSAERVSDVGRGAQTFRLRTRYLDPDVNAFVGLLAGFNHFNQDLRLGNPDDPITSGTFWNWGADIGLKRGKHLWELDLMGAVYGTHLGPALAIGGEYDFTKHWSFYYRAEGNFLVGDMLGDINQGFWVRWGVVRLTAGYRVFVSRHMNRNGFTGGLLFRFENPKIPFIFPSIG